MELADLAALVAISESDSVVAAAERRGEPRSRLVRALARLEQEVGGPLVVSDAGGTRMTRIGRQLVRDARPILAAADEWRERIEQAKAAAS